MRTWTSGPRTFGDHTRAGRVFFAEEILSCFSQIRIQSVRAYPLSPTEQRQKGTPADFRKRHRPRSGVALNSSIRERSFAAVRFRPYLPFDPQKKRLAGHTVQ